MRRPALALLAPALLLLAGCGGTSVTGVEGTLALAGGKPAGNLTVTFNPAGGGGLRGLALTDDAGGFKVKCDDGRGGLPPGKYVVTVFDNDLAAEDEPGKPPKKKVNRVPLKYATADEKTNPLVVTVEAGKGKYELKLD